MKTLDELAALLEKSAHESEQTNQILNDEVIPRLGRVEEQIHEAGLNGHTAVLRQFLDEYAAGQSREQAWKTVKQDIGARLGGLTKPLRKLGRAFLVVIGAASALAWATIGIMNLLHATGHS